MVRKGVLLFLFPVARLSFFCSGVLIFLFLTVLKMFFWPYPIQPISQNALVHWSPLPVKFFSIWENQLARPRAHAFLPAVSTVCHGSVYKRFSPASPADTAMRTEWSNRKISFCATGHATSLVGRCAWNGSSGAVLFRLQSKPLVNRWYAQTRKGLITGFAPQWTSNKPYAHSQLLSFRISYILMWSPNHSCSISGGLAFSFSIFLAFSAQ